jgi:CheY-like chemotaxis protein
MSRTWFPDRPSGPSAPRAARKPRVLIVEDESDTAASLAILVRHWGYEFAAVLDGRLAPEVAVTFRPDIAVVDLALPGLDGYDVAARLRDAPALRGTRFVAMSGYPKEEAERRHPGGSELFDLHLLKPVDPEQLRAILGALASHSPAAGRRTVVTG